MGLTVADVVKLPERMVEPNRGNNISHGRALGFNEALDEISSLKLSPEKVVGMVEINREALHYLFYDRDTMGTKLWEKRPEEIIDAIISNKSKILSIKKSNLLSGRGNEKE